MKIVLCDKKIELLKKNKLYIQPNGQYDRLKGKEINIGHSFTAEPHSSFYTGSTFVSIGSFSYFNSQAPANDLNMKVGRYCSIASGLFVLGLDHPLERFTTSSVTYDRNAVISKGIENNQFSICENANDNRNKSIEIENDVWIGANVTLSRGIKIGNGAVIAACSVVTKDVPPYAVVAGSPARIIKFRFDFEIINRLIMSKWWEYKFSDFNIKADTHIIDFVDYIENINIERYTPEQLTFGDLKVTNKH